MPKIPTFVADAQPTGEVGAVKSNIQISPNETLAASLLPAAKDITNYYIKEKEISNKVEGGELIANAQQELSEVQAQANTKKTPELGVNFFNNAYSNIIEKYKSKANNSYISRFFELNMNASKPSYTSNILKTTRSNMVKTRTTQVFNQIENDILKAVEDDNSFNFATLANSIDLQYQELLKDGLITENDLTLLREDVPKLIEIQQVRKLSRSNAAEAVAALLNPKNYTQIPQDERTKLISEFGTLAKLQTDAIKNNLTSQNINNSKKFIEKFSNNEYLGLPLEELELYKTGDLDFNNQIESLNEKIVNKKFSFDTNYNTNSDIIAKIFNGEIEDTSTQFLIGNETEPKSILERAGDGTINDKDTSFLSLILTRNNTDTFKKQDQAFVKFVNDLTPLLQGNAFLSYFDKNYNSKASQLRQTLHRRYVDGLSKGITVENLLSSNSEDYIAKDIKSYLPKTSDLSSIVIDLAGGSVINNNNVIKKKEGETANEYLKRVDAEGKTFSFDYISEKDFDEQFMPQGLDTVALWNKYYQTENNFITGLKAKERLSRNYTVPEDAKKAISVASKIFDGDGGYSAEQITKFLNEIGQIESQYQTKIQRGENPEITKFYARSYWQIEVTTAKDLLKNSSVVFGPKFEKEFSNYKGNFKTAKEGLLNLSDKELTNIIEKDDSLAASFAAAIIVTRFK